MTNSVVAVDASPRKVLELTKHEVLDLHMACLGRIRVINDLINVTRDPESRDGLHQRLQGLVTLRDRLEQL